MIEFRVLGPLEIEVDGESITLPGRQVRALLTALLMQPGTVVPVPRLVEALWEESPPEAANNALHQVVSRLRSRLRQHGALIRTRPPGYVLDAERTSVDSERFEAELREARERSGRDPTGAAALLGQALARWRGPAYGEFAEGFARAASVRLEELRVSAQEERAALLLASGATTEAIAAARDVQALHPLRARPVEVLMRALHQEGRTGEALESYQSFRHNFSEDLGLDPPLVLRELETRILQEDPAPLTPAVTPATVSPATDGSATVTPATDGSRDDGSGGGPGAAADLREHASPAAGVRRTEPGVGVPGRAVPSNLPWRPGPIVGRESDLELLETCLPERRLVTLVGPGGVGKTRLALEVAHRLATAGTPVWWADLSVMTPDRLVDALAEAVAVDAPRGADPVGEVGEALAGRHGVLCLDNAETVLAELAEVVERLAEAAPDVLVLSTSRERLAVAAEHVHVLAPLPLPDGHDPANPAVRLFLQRAPGLESHDVTDDELGLIAELCRRLDGLPLAIELGAARAPTFGLREFTAQLGEGLDLLAGGRRTALARHRTLRAVIDWSYGLLSPDEALLFERLAIFPGSFSLDQAVSVCADERLPRTAVGPLLARLVEQSLVQAARGRFWLLETLRTYADERLTGADRLALRRRHAYDAADRLTRLGIALGTPDEAATVAAIAALIPDLRAAWDYAVEHDRALGVRLPADALNYAYQRQRRDLLEWGRTVAGWDIDHPQLPAALTAAAGDAWAAGRFTEAREFAVRGLELTGDDSPEAAGPLMQLANLAMFEARNDEAAALYRRAGDLMRAAGLELGTLISEVCVAQVTAYSGRSEEAAALMRDLLRRAEHLGVPSGLAWSHFIAGEALADLDPAAAFDEYAAAVAHGSTIDGRLVVALARSASVALLARHGSPERALGELDRVMSEWEELRNEAAHWWMVLHLSTLLARLGFDRDSAVLAGAVLETRERHFMLMLDEARLGETLRDIRARLGDEATDAALAAGSRLSYTATVAEAKRVIREARQTVQRHTSD